MLDIRDMTRADVPETLALLANWGEHARFYDLAFAVAGCKPLVGLERGRIVATGVAIVNGPTASSGGSPTGWIGTIFVDPGRRGAGLGAAITEAVAERLHREGCRTTALIASPLGRPVYTRIGFTTEAEYAVFQADRLPALPEAPAGATLRRLLPGDRPAVLALDRRATGEDRSGILDYVAAETWLVERGGGVAAFLAPMEGGAGAVVAETPDDALCLLDVRRALVEPGKRAQATVVAGHAGAREALEARGWQFQFTTPRMIRGAGPWPWRPELIWGLLGFAFG